jgi:hypothetical protein
MFYACPIVSDNKNETFARWVVTIMYIFFHETPMKMLLNFHKFHIPTFKFRKQHIKTLHLNGKVIFEILNHSHHNGSD